MIILIYEVTNLKLSTHDKAVCICVILEHKLTKELTIVICEILEHKLNWLMHCYT